MKTQGLLHFFARILTVTLYEYVPSPKRAERFIEREGFSVSFQKDAHASDLLGAHKRDGAQSNTLADAL